MPAGLARIAEAEEVNTSAGDADAASSEEVSEDTSSLRHGMARVKLEHGEASLPDADSEDGALWT